MIDPNHRSYLALLNFGPIKHKVHYRTLVVDGWMMALARLSMANVR